MAAQDRVEPLANPIRREASQGVRMRHRVAFVAAIMAVFLISPASTSANNDPHRTFFGSTPYDLPTGICSFPVHLDFPVVREYAKVSTLADGSTFFEITGSWVVAVSRPGTDRSIELNVGGPGSVTYPADFSSVTEHLRGRTFLFGTNLTDYGFPSNLVATAGPVLISLNLATFEVASLSGHPLVITDVCAALS